MNPVPQIIKGISHPLITEMYLKKDGGSNSLLEDVLVIQTVTHEEGMTESEYNSFDTYLIDILTDLEDIKAQAEKQVGHIDRVDIRAH